MKILGIGNAIVDVLCRVDDAFLSKNSLTKSTMKLINENEFKNLLSNVKIEETVSGGSVANSIVGLSQLGNEVGFMGKIKNVISFVDSLLGTLRKLFVNTLTVLFLMLITFIIFGKKNMLIAMKQFIENGNKVSLLILNLLI